MPATPARAQLESEAASLLAHVVELPPRLFVWSRVGTVDAHALNGSQVILQGVKRNGAVCAT